MDAKGHTPLMVAARGDQVAAMEALALNGADVTARSRDNDNLWTVATFGAWCVEKKFRGEGWRLWYNDLRALVWSSHAHV